MIVPIQRLEGIVPSTTLAKFADATHIEIKNAGDKVLIRKADQTFTPPSGVQAEARRALAWLKDGQAGQGFTAVGRKRASDLASGKVVSQETLARMVSYFARHEVDKQGKGWSPDEPGYPSPGRVAWAAWGGDAGRAWANSKMGSVNKNANVNELVSKFVGKIPKRGNKSPKPAKGRMSRSEAARIAAQARWAGHTIFGPTPAPPVGSTPAKQMDNYGGAQFSPTGPRPVNRRRFALYDASVAARANQEAAGASIKPAIESWDALRGPDGGFTINTGTGTQPTSGFAVAMRGHSKITPVNEFFAKGPDGIENGRKILRDWIRSKADVFSDPSVHVGAWHDPKNGEIVLDAVKVIPDKAEAMRVGRAGNEQSIADLGAISRGDWDNAFLDTGGTGDREVHLANA